MIIFIPFWLELIKWCFIWKAKNLGENIYFIEYVEGWREGAQIVGLEKHFKPYVLKIFFKRHFQKWSTQCKNNKE